MEFNADYFKKKLLILARDASDFTPDEGWRRLM